MKKVKQEIVGKEVICNTCKKELISRGHKEANQNISSITLSKSSLQKNVW